MSNNKGSTVIAMSNWTPNSKKYMAPKLNDKGSKSINVISTQTNRSIHLIMPLMMTWGISDYTDEKTGVSNDKFSMSLNFDNEEYATPEAKEALRKLKEFEEIILNDAVTHSEVWFGKKQSREIVEYSYFPFIKYPKNKDTKQTDYSRPPSIVPKVPKYGDEWKIELYDTNNNLLFPSPQYATPIELVPKKSSVASIITCGGIWVGGKGWGVTWRVIQCVVKPQLMESIYGKCHIPLSSSDIKAIEGKEDNVPTSSNTTTASKVEASKPAEYAEDSDIEEEVVPEPVVEKPVVKKIIKKAVEEPVQKQPEEPETPPPEVKEDVVQPAVEATSEAVSEDAPKKKLVKKVVKKVT